ncbi:MAG: T9SS type A sorting domain-containing protein [Ignavibacteria bacterium]|nr:T9SS type A sorting domain-containing protein [Ignavibacteria bacterium]MBT8381152.1 T9SS type A sorting domain-containing protein [Ignavibacteria bacterium]NNL21650.1 T9SS type A sorting domain-containing protein [Ignavibacteriaceae bacterium]
MNKSVQLLFILAIYLFTLQTFAQYQNIMVGNSINTYEPVEPSVVVNPYNTDQILVGANSDNYYYSTDGGMNWEHGVINSSFGVIGDPCVLVDGNSNYYYFHLVPDMSRVVCQKTGSIGGIWSDGSYTGVNGTKDNDKEWAAIDHNNGNVYVTWAQFDEHGSFNSLDSSEIQLSRSTDGGLTWSVPVVVSDRKGNAQAGNYSDHAPMPAIGPNNEVYVTWMGPEGMMFDKSTDAGITWLPNDINITGSHINWLVFNVPGVEIVPGFPVINCDLSTSSYYGDIYICWTDQRSGYNDTDVWLTKSSDGGLNWTPPIRVNNDGPNRHQFFAWMTIDQSNGYLYFVFYDRRNYATLETDVYMARSTDGGESFTNFMVSQSSFTPSINNYLGHYIGISAHNNIVRPVWTRVDNNLPSLWTAIVDSVTTVEESTTSITPSVYMLFQNYPNPFNPVTNIKYSVPDKSFISLKVYDVLGNEIVALVNETKQADSYTVQFDPSELTSGIYFYRLQAGDFVETKKMILMK